VYLKTKNQPTLVVAGFEKTIHVAAREAVPGITLIGCRFHLSQAWHNLCWVKHCYFINININVREIAESV
jgi:hypothetical protein